MAVLPFLISRCRAPVMWLVAGLLLVGCASKTDWNTRVGVYTYDDAVKDYGPPDKSATTSDGTTVAEWLLRSGQTFANQRFLNYGPYRYYPNMVYGPADFYTTPDYFLRLTFGPDRKLTAVKKFSK